MPISRLKISHFNFLFKKFHAVKEKKLNFKKFKNTSNRKVL